jgi:hypothetical protein
MVTDEDRKAADRPYLIRKQGYWYRPNASGYTDSAIQAGRYSLEEAERHTHPNGKDGPRDGMDYVHEDDLTCPDWLAYKAAEQRGYQQGMEEAAGMLGAMAHNAGMPLMVERYGDEAVEHAQTLLTATADTIRAKAKEKKHG